MYAVPLPDIAPYLARVEYLKASLSSCPTPGSPDRVAILTEIIKIRKLIRAIHELEQQTETTPCGTL